MNKKIIIIPIFIIITLFITVGAATLYKAREIEYTPSNTSLNVDNLEDAIDILYDISKDSINKKVCRLISEEYGTKGNVGSEYECYVSDTEKHNFYILADNGNSYTMIMDRNITQGTSKTTYSWSEAMKYIADNNLKNAWTNVLDIDLPKAQDIANAVGNNSWYAVDKSFSDIFYLDSKTQTPVANSSTPSKYAWLYNYTSGCAEFGCKPNTSLSVSNVYGYWTRDLLSGTNLVWGIGKIGILSRIDIPNDSNYGTRLTIQVQKSNLYE